MQRVLISLLLQLVLVAAPVLADTATGLVEALGMQPAAAAPAVAAPPPVVAPSAVAPVAATTVPFDYSVNINSDVFGAQLFAGNFAQSGPTQFNPDYAISTGDMIQVRMWGGFEYDAVLAVDPQGNIFLPHVGPVQVQGVHNSDLQRIVEAAASRVFRANVFSYASLAAAQPVRVFVGGFVNRPGLYNGTSMESLLHYIDLAGGIDAQRGSFLRVMVKRGDTVRATVNLYDFLLDGRMPQVQLADGDVIFVAPRGNTVTVSGLANNARKFEFLGGSFPVAELARLAKPLATATHVRIVRNSGTVRNVEYFPLAEAAGVSLGNGDELVFTADKKPGTITVRVEGEHQSPQEYVLPYGARLGELMSRIEYSERSDSASLQLFRQSVKTRQKEMLATSLKSLEAAALTARSGTSEEVALRKGEADLLLQWVERARKIEPSGQVLVAGDQWRDLLLENSDLVRIPTRDGLVLVSGEVLFPNAIAFDAQLSLMDYLDRAGGFTQNANAARVVIAHQDGSFTEVAARRLGFLQSREPTATLRPGDQVLVLPRIDVKSRQMFKEMMQIMYQIAVSARVVVGFNN